MDTERKWRVVVCEPGEEPRESERVWRCTSYWTASQWVRRKLLGRKRVWPSQFVRHVSHVFDDEAWHRAETIRVTMYCPVSMTRLLLLEYQDGADCPAELFTVPRPAGRCWRCDRRWDGKGVYCDDCKALRRRTYNSWWKMNARAQGKK